MITIEANKNLIADFQGFAKEVFIKGQNIYDRSTYFLVGEDLITATSKWTKSQQGSTGGKGSVTRFRLNGKAISANDLNDHIKSLENVEVITYSANVYEIKELRSNNKNAVVVKAEVEEVSKEVEALKAVEEVSKEVETPKVFAINCTMVCIINKKSKINVMHNDSVESFIINKKSVDDLLNRYFTGTDRADAMVEIIKYLDDENKIKLFM